MKAISLYQPHASAVANGAKRHETRSKPLPRTLFGRRVAIHAGARRHPAYREIFEENMQECSESRRLFINQLEHGDFDVLPFGAILCTVVFVASRRTDEVRHMLCDRELRWGDYSDGRFAWQMIDLVRLTTPVPAKFHQGVNHIALPDAALADHTADQLAQFGEPTLGLEHSGIGGNFCSQLP